MVTDENEVYVPTEEQQRIIDKQEKKDAATFRRMRGEKPAWSNNSADPMGGDDDEDSKQYRKLFEAIDKLVIYKGIVPSDMSTCEFHLSGEVIRIPADRMMNNKIFKIAYFNTFFSPITLPDEGWTKFVRALTSSDKMEIRSAEESDNVYIASQVFEIVSQLRIDREYEDPFEGTALYDIGDEFLYLLSEKITSILNTLQFKIGMKALSTTMSDLGLKDVGTGLIKRGGKSKRFWAFRKSRFGQFGGI